MRAEVLGIDPTLRQLVLMVRDPRGRDDRDPWTRHNDLQARLEINLRPGTAKYLLGQDERSYFLAELPDSGVTTVRQAHEALKIWQLRGFETHKRDARRIKRQGEWFFVSLQSLDWALIGMMRPVILRKASIGGGTHIADEMMAFPLGGNRQVFVRGRVRHPHHATLRLQDWHFVMPNAQVMESRIPGMVPID